MTRSPRLSFNLQTSSEPLKKTRRSPRSPTSMVRFPSRTRDIEHLYEPVPLCPDLYDLSCHHGAARIASNRRAKPAENALRRSAGKSSHETFRLVFGRAVQ